MRGRYLTIMLNLNQKIFIIHSVYFPSLTNKVDYVVDITNLISKLELNLSNFPHAYHILAGDYNFEIRHEVKEFVLFKDLLDKYNLFCCDGLNTSSLDYTYKHEGLRHQSWIDHFFLSENLKSSVSSFDIIDSVLNCSDHFPISCLLNIDVCLVFIRLLKSMYSESAGTRLI